MERAARGRVAARWRRRRQLLGLLGPPLGWLAVFFLVPVGAVAAYSAGLITLFRGDSFLSLEVWRSFLEGSVYTGLFWKSVRMSLTVSVVAIVLAYPIGYFLAMVVGRRKYVLLLLTIAPFLTSFLLRILAWRVILGDSGVINSSLFALNIREPGDPVSWLLYSQFTVMLVLIYIWVPFVALPIFVSLENIDHSLLEAAHDLGATRWRAFWRITFPLSLPGVVAAFLFVFIPTIGEYITPLLVGGTKGFMFGNAIAEQFQFAFNWQLGSVLAIFLVAVVAVLIAVSSRFLNVRALTAE